MTIQLSCNPTLDAVAITHLSAGKWPLNNLNLSHKPVSAAMAVQLQLSNLTKMSLTNSGFKAAAVSELARADHDWPVFIFTWVTMP